MAGIGEAKPDPDALSPQAVQIILVAVILASERFLEPSSLEELLEGVPHELGNVSELPLEPPLKAQVARGLELFQQARYQVYQLREPPGDPMQ